MASDQTIDLESGDVTGLPYPEVELVPIDDVLVDGQPDPGNDREILGLVGNDEPDDLEAEDAIEAAKADPSDPDVT